MGCRARYCGPGLAQAALTPAGRATPRGAAQGHFLAPLTIEPMSTTVFSGGAVAHVFAAHP